jgi:hypothetical protein
VSACPSTLLPLTATYSHFVFYVFLFLYFILLIYKYIRFDTKEVMCMRCKTIQPATNLCTTCNQSFAKYSSLPSSLSLLPFTILSPSLLYLPPPPSIFSLTQYFIDIFVDIANFMTTVQQNKFFTVSTAEFAALVSLFILSFFFHSVLVLFWFCFCLFCFVLFCFVLFCFVLFLFLIC